MTDNPVAIAECNVLGGIMISCEALPPGIELLTPGDFADPKHGEIFAAMLSLHERKEPIDQVTVNAELTNRGAGKKADWYPMLSALTAEAVTAANVPHYAAIVRRDARRRDCLVVMGEALLQARTPGTDGDEIIARVVTELGHLAESRALIRPALARDLIRDEMKALEERHKNGVVVGAQTGFVNLDRVLGGLQAGDLTIIAARPGMGKSALATGIMANMSLRNGMATLLISLEMSQTQQTQRLIAAEARVDLNRIRTGQGIGSADWPKLAAAGNRLFTDKIAIMDKGGLSVTEVRAATRTYAARNPIGALFVDYLQLMTGSGDNREQEVSSISRGLKALAMELKIPIIALSQLNRSVEARTNKRPMLSDLRDSGSIEQDADQVLFIYRDDYYDDDSKEKGIAEISIAKNRNGPTGMIKLRWEGKFTRFEPLSAADEMAA